MAARFVLVFCVQALVYQTIQCHMLGRLNLGGGQGINLANLVNLAEALQPTAQVKTTCQNQLVSNPVKTQTISNVLSSNMFSNQPRATETISANAYLQKLLPTLTETVMPTNTYYSNNIMPTTVTETVLPTKSYQSNNILSSALAQSLSALTSETVLPTNTYYSNNMLPTTVTETATKPCASNNVLTSFRHSLPTETVLPTNTYYTNNILPTVTETETVLPTNSYVSNNVQSVSLPSLTTEAVLPNGMTVLVPGSSVVEDANSVSHNLANTLQLLVVSNLLSNTLPLNGLNDVILPLNVDSIGTAEQVVGNGYVNAQILNNNVQPSCSGNLINLN